MRFFFRKLLFGKRSMAERHAGTTINKRLRNIKAIWNNQNEDDIGIEKILRLFLAFTQFIFPGLYIRHFLGGTRVVYQELCVDLYVLAKMAFPFIVIYNGWFDHPWIFWLVVYLMVETLLYVPTLIFASDIFDSPRSYRRSMLLLFFNYLQVVFDFGVIYSHGEFMNAPFEHWFDGIYFSFIAGATVGFGDFHPITPLGKFLVSAQTVMFLIFAALFLNFFSNKVERKGYFEPNKSDIE